MLGVCYRVFDCVCAGVGVFVYLTGLNIHIDIIAMTASRDSCEDNKKQFFHKFNKSQKLLFLQILQQIFVLLLGSVFYYRYKILFKI